MGSISVVSSEVNPELIAFTQDLVRIKSFSGQEEEAIRFIERKMSAIGYEKIVIDSMGNLLGRIGNGEKAILFDSHIDTVGVNDEAQWDVPPFSGEIIDGRLYGRGSVDMKSGAAASIFAGALAKKLGFITGKTLFVTCTVFEEDCDGENLKHLFRELSIKPDYAVICEPSGNQISLGHKGKAQVSVKAYGLSAHGAAPEKGMNAIYEMAEIIQRVERRNAELMQKGAPRGSLVMSQISSRSASLNAVPSECEAYLDRRLAPGETEADVKKEMDELIQGKRAAWEVGTLYRKSWTGMDIRYEPFHLAWKIDLEHELTRACIAAFHDCFGREPAEYDYWDFSTNAVTPVSMGIPTIGFGPGEHKLAHMVNEHCPVSQIVDACSFYTRLIQKISVGVG
jgi:putative selenium metabolism hydrolase